MSEPRIVTDPDETKWVSVDVDAHVARLLQDEAEFERFCKAVHSELLRLWGEKVDREIGGEIP